MDTNVHLSVLRLNHIFRKICAKVRDPTDLPSLKEDVVVTLNMFEWEFMGVFFNVMTHLVLDVVEKMVICGPVHSRWMYLIEQTMGTFKKYVCNCARPKASMALGYMLDETLGFITKYMQTFTHV